MQLDIGRLTQADPARELAAYRIVQEALTNTLVTLGRRPRTSASTTPTDSITPGDVSDILTRSDADVDVIVDILRWVTAHAAPEPAA